jgi:hypothetical protein
MRLRSAVARHRLFGHYKMKTLSAVVGGSIGGYLSSLLLHFNGANPYDIFDSSANAIAVTNANSVVVQPAAAKFGSRGLQTGGYPLTVAKNDVYSNLTGDFTIDFWVNGTNASNGQFYISANNPDFGSMTVFGLVSSTFGSRLALWNSTGGSYTSTIARGTADISAFGVSTFVHIAMTRQAGVVRFFVNGVIDKQFAYPDAINFGRFAGDVLIGAGPPGANPQTGSPSLNMDEFRFINGSAAWIDTFTPPTLQYTQ